MESDSLLEQGPSIKQTYRNILHVRMGLMG